MGSVEKSDRNGKVRYLARWRDDAGKQRKKSFVRKGDADRFVIKVEADLLAGQYVDPTDRTTVTEYARRWAATRVHRVTTARTMANLIDNHIDGTRLGSRRLAAVVPTEVQAWAADRAKVLAPMTLHHLVGLLRSVYASAVLDRLVGRSPVVRLSLPATTRDRIVPLTVSQVRALATAVPRRNEAMVVTQAGLGLRIGELLALRTEDVDFDAGLVTIEWQFCPRTMVRVMPKTRRSRRVIPLPKVVAYAIEQHLDTFAPDEDGTVFTTRFGGPYQHSSYGTRIFVPAAKAAGLPVGTTTHDLRHHYASVLLAQGESVIVVAERLGHENANLVLSTYGHLMPDTEDKTRKAIDDAWACATGVPFNDKEGL